MAYALLVFKTTYMVIAASMSVVIMLWLLSGVVYVVWRMKD